MADSWGSLGLQRHISSLSAVLKFFLGWIRPVDALDGMNTLHSYQETGEVFQISPGNNEFILIENRRPVFQESFISGGILVWHLDLKYIINGGPFGTSPNSNELQPNSPFSWPFGHPAVRVIQADGLFQLEPSSSRGNIGDYFGYDSNQALSDDLLHKPNLNNYANMGSPSGLKLFEFSPAGDTMSFTFQYASVSPSLSLSSSPSTFMSRYPSRSASSSPTSTCIPGKDCLRCWANCFARPGVVVNNFNSYNCKEKRGGYFTLYSFREFAVGSQFLPGQNKRNKPVS